MSERDRHLGCAVCTTTEGPFERHHIALRGNHESATVMLCRPCHDEQTDRQRQAGLFTRRSIEARDELQTLHALIEGVAGMLAANARGLGDERLALSAELDRRATLRLLALASDGRPGQLGPRPISNDRHKHIRQGASSCCREAPSLAVKLQTLAPLVGVLVDVVDAMLPDEVGQALVREFALALASLSRQLADDPERCAALVALDDHPRADDLTALTEQGRALWHDLVEQIDALGMADGRDAHPNAQLIETAGAFKDVAHRSLGLLQALATGENPVEALDRCLADSDHKPRGLACLQERPT